MLLKRNIFSEDCQFPKLITKEDYVLWLNIAKRKIVFYGLNEKLTRWRKLNNSLSSSTFQKLVDGFKVYNEYMGYNKFISLMYLLRLSINFLIKR